MKIFQNNTFILLTGLTLLLSTVTYAGNRELMKQKKLRALLLNESVIDQIGDFKNDELVSFIGRVVKRNDGGFEILVEQIDKNPLTQNISIKPHGRYIEYMSFEEMQKLPKVKTYDKASSFYGGGEPVVR